jgi:hypothetical protein
LASRLSLLAEKTVEAGLLAKASVQATLMLNVLPCSAPAADWPDSP